MTRKKAIEAAVEYAWDGGEDGANIGDLAPKAAEHAYESGRIAGLREAARLVKRKGTVYQSADIFKFRCIEDLAKKARGK